LSKTQGLAQTTFREWHWATLREGRLVPFDHISELSPEGQKIAVKGHFLRDNECLLAGETRTEKLKASEARGERLSSAVLPGQERSQNVPRHRLISSKQSCLQPEREAAYRE
jgi:hypothetical protein